MSEKCFVFHKSIYNLLKGKVLSARLLCCTASCFFCASADHFEGTWREERQAKCGTGVVRPGGARGWVFTLCRWSCTRACFPRGWGCDSLESSENHSDVTILLSSLIYILNLTFFYCCLDITENGLSVPSDASLSPASQNSPYSITPVSQGSPASSGIGSPMASNAITKIHSRRFRE